MKKIFTSTLLMLLPLLTLAQGWPTNYDGVMLQGFYWDSFDETRWPKLESQAGELAEFFKLVWIPQSADCGGQSMGYDDFYWFPGHYNSSFGSEDQLRSMINTFKSKGIGTIADVVVNHRKTIDDWVTFPTEVYKGVTYKMNSTDICRNDDGGATLNWANQNGKQLSANNDTGEDWGGMRDLDHKSTNVQSIIKAYVKMLLDDLGYTGFRYDMVKGYSAQYTGMYNVYSGTQFSVGEYWDGNEGAVKSWIDGTKVDSVVQSAAFDFPFRYVIRDAANNNRWTSLSASASRGLNMDSDYKRYSVTFIENHDTQYRIAAEQQDPIKNNVEAANAFLLAMPGTPCIFLKHWIDYKESIKQMIYARQLAGITNTSISYNMAIGATSNYYVQRTVGTRGALLAAMGSASYEIPLTFVVVVSGDNYRLALSKVTETAWASKPSGEYSGTISVQLTVVSQTDGAQLVYTTDGSTPTASNGTRVADGTNITISKSTTLKVGLLINGVVSGIISRNYEMEALIDDFEVDGIYYRALSENTAMVIQKPGENEYYQGDIVIPDCVSHQDMQFTVTAIDSRAFEDCYELNSIVIGNEVESIGEEAFQGCTGLTSVTIGTGVANIGAKAFNYCNTLQTVTCEGTMPPAMENSNCFSSAAYRNAVLKVPRLFVEAYTAADYWYKFNQIEGFGSIGMGDVNADGVLNISDITILIRMVLLSTEYNADGDLNNNGKLDIGDVTSLIVYVLSM